MIEKLKGIYEIGHTGHTTLYAMEGLRGLAIFLVFLVHYITLSEPWISKTANLHYYASIVRSFGNIGVDLFFVLSGYLIYGSLIRKEGKFIPYLHRRIERIYPTFTAVFILYLVLSFVFPNESKIPDGPLYATKYIAENYLLLPGIFNINPIITVAWSLSYEFFFYLTVPLLIFLLRLRRWVPIKRIAFFLLLSVAVLGWPEVVGGHIRMAMFIVGILVFEVSSYCRQPTPTQLGLPGIVVLGLAFVGTVAQTLYGFNGQWKYAILAVSFFVLCLACFSGDGYVSKIFRWTPQRWLGNISYSYYLIHGLVLKTIFLAASKLFLPTGDNLFVFWFLLALTFPATFFISSILFLLVEKPFSLSRHTKNTFSIHKKRMKLTAES
jgi:exopolysaccharide production protein ExoZ